MRAIMKEHGLYDPIFEHDSCGVGFVATINGQASHEIVDDGMTILKKPLHRGRNRRGFKNRRWGRNADTNSTFVFQ